MFSSSLCPARLSHLSNQTLDLEEDKQNKPYRPIPAGLISLRSAIILRWILPFICFAWSASYSKELLHASIFNCLLVLIYDEMGFAGGHWFGKQVLNALGHVRFELGASLLAGHSILTLDPIAVRSIICSGSLVFFTIQAQDFKDAIGDAAVGRRTLPIAHSKLARPSFMTLITACSIGLCNIWQLPLALAVLFIAFGTTIGWLFVKKTSKGEDKKHLFLYLIWLSIAHAMPAYFRFVVAQAAWVQ